MTPEQWREDSIPALMAYCNHGPCCADTTFRGLKDLEELAPDDLEALMLAFATAKRRSGRAGRWRPARHTFAGIICSATLAGGERRKGS